MQYIQNTCNIRGCKEHVYRNYLCRYHYDFYINNNRMRELNEDVIAVYEKRASFTQKIKSLFHSIIHLSFDVPMPRYEHFPLEHIYLTALRNEDKKNVKRLEKIIADFDIPENENIAMMKRSVNSNNVESVKVQPIKDYLFEQKELLKIWPLIISVFGILAIFGILKHLEIHGDYCGISSLAAIEIYKREYPLMVIFVVGSLCGMLIPRSYNNFAKRAYDLNLYEKTEENLELLTQILYVKERNQRSITYKYSIYGSLIGATAMFLCYYFVSSDFSLNSILLLLATMLVILPILYCYNMSVLYFPIFECMKRRSLIINLYHADGMGGQKEYHNFLFKTFVYNETVISVVLTLGFLFAKWWMWIFFIPILLFRANHAGACIIMYLRSVAKFYKEWNVEHDRLMTSSDVDALERMQSLSGISINRVFSKLIKICILVLLPYIINHIDEWLPIIQDVISQVVSFLSLS